MCASNVPICDQAEALNGLGIFLYEREKYEDAAQLYEDAIGFLRSVQSLVGIVLYHTMPRTASCCMPPRPLLCSLFSRVNSDDKALVVGRIFTNTGLCHVKLGMRSRVGAYAESHEHCLSLAMRSFMLALHSLLPAEWINVIAKPSLGLPLSLSGVPPSTAAVAASVASGVAVVPPAAVSSAPSPSSAIQHSSRSWVARVGEGVAKVLVPALGSVSHAVDADGGSPKSDEEDPTWWFDGTPTPQLIAKPWLSLAADQAPYVLEAHRAMRNSGLVELEKRNWKAATMWTEAAQLLVCAGGDAEMQEAMNICEKMFKRIDSVKLRESATPTR